MTANEYQNLAMRTCSIPYKDKQGMLIHATTGLASEAGEFASLLQKTYQGHEYDRTHALKELGDCCWMVAEACIALDVTLEEVMQMNIDKLKARYPEGFDYVIPPSVKNLGSGAVEDYKRQMSLMHEWYCQWQERLEKGGYHGESANQDARFVLPNAATTSLVMTMNARELRHFFELRCCNRAQWEIRELAWNMLAAVRAEAPEIFRDAGPGCVRGKCPEGKRTCGEPYMRERDADETAVREGLS